MKGTAEMTDHEAYARAMKAINAADINNEWDSMTANEIFNSLRDWLAFELKQGPRPETDT